MNVFRKLWQAIENLATSLDALAGTVDAFAGQVRERAGVSIDAEPRLLADGSAEAEPTALPTPRRRR